MTPTISRGERIEANATVSPCPYGGVEHLPVVNSSQPASRVGAPFNAPMKGADLPPAPPTLPAITGGGKRHIPRVTVAIEHVQVVLRRNQPVCAALTRQFIHDPCW